MNATLKSLDDYISLPMGDNELKFIYVNSSYGMIVPEKWRSNSIIFLDFICGFLFFTIGTFGCSPRTKGNDCHRISQITSNGAIFGADSKNDLSLGNFLILLEIYILFTHFTLLIGNFLQVKSLLIGMTNMSKCGTDTILPYISVASKALILGFLELPKSQNTLLVMLNSMSYSKVVSSYIGFSVEDLKEIKEFTKQN